MRSTATRVEGGYALNGTKQWITNAAKADWYFVLAYTDPAQGHRGMTGFAVPVPLDAFTISLMWHPRMDGDRAHRWLRECVRRACGAAA